jgi:hypothetical protein
VVGRGGGGGGGSITLSIIHLCWCS